MSFSQFTCFIYTHFLVGICLNMFRFCVSSICHFSIQVCPHRLSRAIHQHFFSRLTCAQFTDSINCLTNTYFILVCTDYYIFVILLIFLNLIMSVYVSFPCFTWSGEQPWTATQKGQCYYLDVQRATLVPIRLLVHIHVCYTLPHKIHTTQFRIHPPVTHTEVRKHFHTSTVALRL